MLYQSLICEPILCFANGEIATDLSESVREVLMWSRGPLEK